MMKKKDEAVWVKPLPTAKTGGTMVLVVDCGARNDRPDLFFKNVVLNKPKETAIKNGEGRIFHRNRRFGKARGNSRSRQLFTRAQSHEARLK